MKPIITSVLVWLVILLGVSLRTFNADRYPIDNNDDGLYYAWAGSGFWDHPLYLATHSIFEKGNPNLIWRSQFKDYLPVERMGLKIVSPWFDHPPLGTVLIGLPARMLNYPPFAQIPHLIVRLPALIASLFTLWLTYLLAKDLFGRRVVFCHHSLHGHGPPAVFFRKSNDPYLALAFSRFKVLAQNTQSPEMVADYCHRFYYRLV
jgi:hypothetical protein